MAENAQTAERGLLTNFQNTKDRLDKISPSFCLAKWNQVTIHLSNGTTHSCHHCQAHTIPLKELKDNPSALHNTMQKKLTRQQMLKGERPKECDFCWRVEDLKEEGVFSDRVRKSNDPWNKNDLEELPKMPWDANIPVRYMELDFSNACNFKCMYCSPSYSTTWTKEIKEFGPYKDGATTFNSLEWIKKTGHMPLEVEEDDNPYIVAFWKWLPTAIKDLDTIRLTGGEPLLSKNTFKLINYLLENPQPELNFHINSNLGAPKQYIDKLITHINLLFEKKAVKEIKVFTSGEGHGKKGEYIRFGLKYDYWLDNVDRLLAECPKLLLTCMCTYNALSVTSFTEHAKALYELAVKHTHADRKLPVNLSIPYLRHPEFLSAWILTEEYLKYMEESVAYLESCTRKIIKNEKDEIVNTTPGFPEGSAHDMKRVTEVVRNAIINDAGRFKDVSINRRSFHTFIDEFDRRRETSFLSTFPEMANFYHFCKSEYP